MAVRAWRPCLDGTVLAACLTCEPGCEATAGADLSFFGLRASRVLRI